MDSLHKIAIVTGSASGIGIGTGRILAENDASVILCDRNESLANNAAATLQRENLPVTSMYADIANQSSITAMVQQVLTKFGAIDIVVTTLEYQELQDRKRHSLRDKKIGTSLSK